MGWLLGDWNVAEGLDGVGLGLSWVEDEDEGMVGVGCEIFVKIWLRADFFRGTDLKPQSFYNLGSNQTFIIHYSPHRSSHNGVKVEVVVGE